MFTASCCILLITSGFNHNMGFALLVHWSQQPAGNRDSGRRAVPANPCRHRGAFALLFRVLIPTHKQKNTIPVPEYSRGLRYEMQASFCHQALCLSVSELGRLTDNRRMRRVANAVLFLNRDGCWLLWMCIIHVLPTFPTFNIYFTHPG